MTTLTTWIDLADVGMVMTVFVVLVVSYILSRRAIRDHKRKAHRYPFFAARDGLIRLVAKKKLSKDSLVFRLCYPLSNSFIPRANTESLEEVVRVLQEARREGCEPMDGDVWAEFEAEVRNSDPEVAQVVNSLFGSITRALVRNSSFLMTLQYVREHLHWVWKKRDNFPKGGRRHLSQRNREVYELYERYSNAAKRIADTPSMAAAT